MHLCAHPGAYEFFCGQKGYEKLMFFSVIVTVLAFGIMVILHEAGHFFVAKKMGVTVHEFSVGMGPCLFKKQKGETQYSVRLLPLGGYVKLEGEGEESDDPRAFSNISPLKRMGILVAGAAMNILLGFLCFVLINNLFGFVSTTVVSDVVEGSHAEMAGIRAGDEIVRLNNTRVSTKADVDLYMLTAPEEIKVTYLRDGERKVASITPTLNENGRRIIGFYSTVKKLNFIESLEYSYYDTRYVVKAVFASLKMLFSGEAKVSDMSGPVGIVQIVDTTTDAVTEQGGSGKDVLINLLYLFGMISVNLGVFNLLPIPALDGGSIIFAFIELVTRKKQKPEILGYINMIGLAIILLLGVYVMFSDIMKLIHI